MSAKLTKYESQLTAAIGEWEEKNLGTVEELGAALYMATIRISPWDSQQTKDEAKMAKNQILRLTNGAVLIQLEKIENLVACRKAARETKNLLENR